MCSLKHKLMMETPGLSNIITNDERKLDLLTVSKRFFKPSDGVILRGVCTSNDYNGNSISGHDHYILCSSVMLGTACTA